MEPAEEYTSDRTCRGELQDLYRGLCLYIPAQGGTGEVPARRGQWYSGSFSRREPVAVRNGVYVYQGSTSGRCRGDHRRTYRDHAEYVAEDPRRTGEIF